MSLNKNSIRLLFNTHYDAAGSRVWVHELREKLQTRGLTTAYNDWENYHQYDVVLFMPKDEQIDAARQKNNRILIGLIDPKTKSIEQAKKVDFLIVSSMEQRDLFLQYNPNCFVFYPFPQMAKQNKKHTQKSKIVLGYHGNKIHLHSFYPHLTLALNQLGEKYDLELLALYDIGSFGMWTMGCPDPERLKVHHIQWSPQKVDEVLSEADIGLVPACMPIRKEKSLKEKAIYSKTLFATDPNDYLVRFKYSTNPGRMYVFSQLGIPVVAGFFPSACQFIYDGIDGFLAHNAAGWYYAIERLILQPDLRERTAKSLYDKIHRYADPEETVSRFLDTIVTLKSNFRSSPTPSFQQKSPSSMSFRLQLCREFLASRVLSKVKRILNR